MLILVSALLLPTPVVAIDRRDELMDRIEATITLPPRALPLTAYGRYYAFADANHVRAIYFLPPSLPDFSDGCSIATEDGSRPCTDAENEDSKAQLQGWAASYLPAGQRRWFDTVAALPIMSDGGCGQVTIDYDIVAARFEGIRCNGFG